jgi:hypothetical protein
MGQQHRKVAKRRRRGAYLERKKAQAKEAAGARGAAKSSKGKKTAAAE